MSADAMNRTITESGGAIRPSAASLSQQATQLAAQFRTLPRALRWALVAVVAVGLYALFNATTWEWARQAGAAADALQAELDKANRRPLVDQRLRGVVLAYGPIRLPPSEEEGQLGLADAVNEVLKTHKAATKINDQSQSGGRLQGTGLAQILQPGTKAAQVSREVEFIAPPHVASAIIRDLETHPNVDAISRVEMKVLNEKTRELEVKITIQAWVASDDRQRRGSS